MNNRIIINIKIMLIFSLLFLYPVLPVNYYIGPFNTANFCSMMIIIFFIVFNKKYTIIKIKYIIPFFWIFNLTFAIQATITQGILTGISYLVMYIIIPYIIITIVTDYKRFFRVIDMIIISGFILSIIGIMESLAKKYIFQQSLLDASQGIRYGVLRCTATFGHPINFGLFQAIAIILCFYRLNTSIRSKNKKWYLMAYITSVISLFLSVSRLAICMYITVQLILLLQMGWKKVIKYLLVVLIIAIVLFNILTMLDFGIVNLVNDFFISLLDMVGLATPNTINQDVVGFGNRFDLYKWVVDSVGNKFVFGLGVNAKFEYRMYEWFTKTSIEVHYLNIFYQCGLVGLISLILSYITTLKYFFRKLRLKSKYENKISFCNVIFTIFLVYYVCLFGVQETDISRIYCELIALGVAYVRIYYKGCNEKI